MSMFRQCRRVHTAARNTGISRFKTLPNTLEFRAASNAGTVSQLAVTVHLHQSHRVIILMNTKMILAAVALSLSLAACAKKEEPAEAAQDAAATASEAAGRLRMLLVTRLPLRAMPLLLRRRRCSGRDAACRPAAEPAEAVMLSHSVIVPVSTSDRRAQDTGRRLSARCPSQRSLPRR